MRELIIKPAKECRSARMSKILLYGESGSGKTLTSLQLATIMCRAGSKIVVIDTENNTSSIYSDSPYNYEFSISEMHPPYDITALPEMIYALEEYVGEGGVIIVDSLSAFWSERGGVLETIESWTGGDFSKSMQAWGKMQSRTNAVGEVIQNLKKAHIICTARAKGESIIRTYTNKRTGRLGSKTEVVSTTYAGKSDWGYKFDIMFLMQQRLREDGDYIITIENRKPPRIAALSNRKFSVIEKYDDSYEIWNAKEVAELIISDVQSEDLIEQQNNQMRKKLRNIFAHYETKLGTKHPLEKETDISSLDAKECEKLGKLIFTELKEKLQQVEG